MSEIEHKGLHMHRLSTNPAERIFADEWKAINGDRYGLTLRYLLAEDNNLPADEMTERDAKVAATVVQWPWFASGVGVGAPDSCKGSSRRGGL